MQSQEGREAFVIARNYHMKGKQNRTSREAGFLLEMLQVLFVEARQVPLFAVFWFLFLDAFVFHSDVLCMFE